MRLAVKGMLTTRKQYEGEEAISSICMPLAQMQWIAQALLVSTSWNVRHKEGKLVVEWGLLHVTAPRAGDEQRRQTFGCPCLGRGQVEFINSGRS
jgi:hypothetical protein